jgi:hypothetical protein
MRARGTEVSVLEVSCCPEICREIRPLMTAELAPQDSHPGAGAGGLEGNCPLHRPDSEKQTLR